MSDEPKKEDETTHLLLKSIVTERQKKGKSSGKITTKYGVYDYDYWAKPIPSRIHDWTWNDEDYDPTPDYYAEGDIPVHEGERGFYLTGSAATIDGMIDDIIIREYEAGVRPESEVPSEIRQRLLG